VEGREPAVDLLGPDDPMSLRLARSAVVLAGVAALMLSGCSGDAPAPSAASSGPASPGTPAPTPAPTARSSSPPAPPAAPRAGACYRLSTAELTRPTSASDPVPCSRRHTARTIHVGTLVADVEGHAVAVDSDVVQRQLATTCPRRLASYVGGSAKDRALSRFRVVWYSPTLAQSDAGADWFRCDLIVFSKDDSLLPLPRSRSLRHVLDRRGALGSFGLCGTAAPGAAGFSRVVCGRRHSWRAVDTITIAGGRRYPGRATVRAAGDSACRARARARSGNALKFRYGWEWPTRAQWRGGQHYGYCWLPS
jgi:hypothetical protein